VNVDVRENLNSTYTTRRTRYDTAMESIEDEVVISFVNSYSINNIDSPLNR